MAFTASFTRSLVVPVLLLLASCSGGGGKEEPPPPPPVGTGDLQIFFRLHLEQVAVACAADPLCFCSGGVCGQANLEIQVQGAVTRTRNPLLPFGSDELGAGLLEDDGTELSDLPPGGYIVTIRRRPDYPADLNTRSTTSGVPHFVYFNLGLPVTFPIVVAEGNTSSVLVDATAVPAQSFSAHLPPLEGEPVCECFEVLGRPGVAWQFRVQVLPSNH